MAFVVEDGTGLTNATSYASEAEADTYLTDHASSADLTTWNALSTTGKERALIIGTRYLELVFGSRYRGVRKTDDQALGWPRSLAFSDDDVLYDEDAIPSLLKDATSEAALREAKGEDLLGDVDTTREIKAERVRVGPIEEDIEYSGSKPEEKKFTKIERLMRQLVDPALLLKRS